ncbi:MAG: Ig-like domain-containing protein [Nitrospirae bacterium]|nr:Ig-like domain-containing protein [Nitrospirota bacterium]
MKKRSLLSYAQVLIILLFLGTLFGGCGSINGGAQNSTAGASPSDTTPPAVTSTTPANNSTDVGINTIISAVFSEQINPSTLITANFIMTSNGTNIPIIVTYNGTSVTITPTASLLHSNTYTVTITTGIKDISGNNMTNSFSWSFTTDAAPDSTPPSINSTAPERNTTGVASNASLTATFSEPINPSTITTATFTLTKTDGSSVTGEVSYNGNTATFKPLAPLSYLTDYTANITSAVKDSAGNGMTNDYTWTFTTGSALDEDTTPPSVSSTYPENNTTDIPSNISISATFSESINTSTVNTTTFTLAKSGGSDVTGDVSYNGMTATFNPSVSLDDSSPYNATITTGVKDLAGNYMASNKSWSFTTGITPDTTPPAVILDSFAPAGNSTGISADTSVSATFSEAMNPLTITTETFTLKKTDGSTIAGNVTYNNGTATFKPSAPLSYEIQYTATITTGVQDVAGNALVNNYSWTFTTGSTMSNIALDKIKDAISLEKLLKINSLFEITIPSQPELTRTLSGDISFQNIAGDANGSIANVEVERIGAGEAKLGTTTKHINISIKSNIKAHENDDGSWSVSHISPNEIIMTSSGTPDPEFKIKWVKIKNQEGVVFWETGISRELRNIPDGLPILNKNNEVTVEMEIFTPASVPVNAYLFYDDGKSVSKLISNGSTYSKTFNIGNKVSGEIHIGAVEVISNESLTVSPSFQSSAWLLGYKVK